MGYRPVHPDHSIAISVDITDEEAVQRACDRTIARFGGVDVLINNAANNPVAEGEGIKGGGRLEDFGIDAWERDIAVGLTGAFLCCKTFGHVMSEHKGGIIVNIASDLSVIAPDQRIYRDPSAPDGAQSVKPISYSVVKTGLVGLTRYLSTYWAEHGVRVNALSPGGVYNGQSDSFVKRLTNLIPMARMAAVDEYRGALLFLCSDASRYMTGQNIVIDGGRTVW